MEVYIDDMKPKSKAEEYHLVDLREIFERSKKYGPKLNPNKCIFEATSGKLLGLLWVSRASKLTRQRSKPLSKTTNENQKEVRGFPGMYKLYWGFSFPNCNHLWAFVQATQEELTNDLEQWLPNCLWQNQELPVESPCFSPPILGRPLWCI